VTLLVDKLNLTKCELWFLLITNWTHFFNVFISLLYMFRATQCSSSGESIVSIHHLVNITLCRWSSVMRVRDLHTSLSTQSDIYRVLQKILKVFKSRYIGNRMGWGNATKVSGYLVPCHFSSHGAVDRTTSCFRCWSLFQEWRFSRYNTTIISQTL